jgi:hypothetical protein
MYSSVKSKIPKAEHGEQFFVASGVIAFTKASSTYRGKSQSLEALGRLMPGRLPVGLRAATATSITSPCDEAH